MKITLLILLVTGCVLWMPASPAAADDTDTASRDEIIRQALRNAEGGGTNANFSTASGASSAPAPVTASAPTPPFWPRPQPCQLFRLRPRAGRNSVPFRL